MTKRRPILLDATCPLCGSSEVIRLPVNWQELVEAGARVRIVACGNPWHYAEFPVVPAPALAKSRDDG